jgi:beta-lysine 5,6-aminomutase beta subunit
MSKIKPNKNIRPYGDSLGDGAVQVSFTIPGISEKVAEVVAKRLASKMGIEDAFVSFSSDIGSEMTFIVLYGRTRHSVDLSQIEDIIENTENIPDMKTIDRLIGEKIGREIVVVGACIESDAHTVGIDAIMNMKGYSGDYGLERYKNIRAVNMGAQVTSEEVAAEALKVDADVILISQVVTQRNVHIKNLTRLVDIVESKGIREKVILIVGGPRITEKIANEIGFDTGFGRGTLPSHVAYFILKSLTEKGGRP